MIGLLGRGPERNQRRSTTARRRRQGRALKPSPSLGVPKGTVVVGSRERPLSLGLPQRPRANGGLAPRSRELISSAFPGAETDQPGATPRVPNTVLVLAPKGPNNPARGNAP